MPPEPRKPRSLAPPPPDAKRSWYSPPPPKPPGDWIPYSYGRDIRGWHLTVGEAFHADIGPGQGGFLLTVNMQVITTSWDVEDLKATAERLIVARVRKMRPAYAAIYGRVRARYKAKGTVAFTGPDEDAVKAAVEGGGE